MRPVLFGVAELGGVSGPGVVSGLAERDAYPIRDWLIHGDESDAG